MALTGEEKAEMMKKALALYLDIDEEDVGNYVFGCEIKKGDDGVMFYGGYSSIAHWYLIGMCEELKSLLEKNRVVPGPTVKTIPMSEMEQLLRGDR